MLLCLICNCLVLLFRCCLFGWLLFIKVTLAQRPNSVAGFELRGCTHGCYFKYFGEYGFSSFRGVPICTNVRFCVCFIFIHSYYNFSLHTPAQTWYFLFFFTKLNSSASGFISHCCLNIRLYPIWNTKSSESQINLCCCKHLGQDQLAN